MKEYDLAHLITTPRALYQLTIPPIEDEEGRAVLLKHAQECIIYFPEGTIKIEMFLRNIHPRYRITLPDGYELHELYDRYQNIHILLYQSEQPHEEM